MKLQAPSIKIDLFDIADEITAELVNLEQVRYLLDVIATDFQKVGQEKRFTDDYTYTKNRISQFIDLAKAQLISIDKSISASVESIVQIYSDK